MVKRWSAKNLFSVKGGKEKNHTPKKYHKNKAGNEPSRNPYPDSNTSNKRGPKYHNLLHRSIRAVKAQHIPRKLDSSLRKAAKVGVIAGQGLKIVGQLSGQKGLVVAGKSLTKISKNAKRDQKTLHDLRRAGKKGSGLDTYVDIAVKSRAKDIIAAEIKKKRQARRQTSNGAISQQDQVHMSQMIQGAHLPSSQAHGHFQARGYSLDSSLSNHQSVVGVQRKSGQPVVFFKNSADNVEKGKETVNQTREKYNRDDVLAASHESVKHIAHATNPPGGVISVK